MSTNIPTNPKSNNPKLKLVRTASMTLRLAGMEPAEDMAAGEYPVSCQSAVVNYEKKRVDLHHQVIDGPHTGTGLRQWISFAAGAAISPKSRYAKQAAVALGRPLNTGDDLNNPGAIFSGRNFRAFVGFRKTDRPRGGIFSDEFAMIRKDKDDGLRVHELLKLEEL